MYREREREGASERTEPTEQTREKANTQLDRTRRQQRETRDESARKERKNVVKRLRKQKEKKSSFSKTPRKNALLRAVLPVSSPFYTRLFFGFLFYALSPRVKMNGKNIPPSLLGLRVRREVRNRLGRRRELVRLGVGDLDAKLLLEGHDELDGVEGVEAEVAGEGGRGGDLFSCLWEEGGNDEVRTKRSRSRSRASNKPEKKKKKKPHEQKEEPHLFGPPMGLLLPLFASTRPL